MQQRLAVEILGGFHFLKEMDELTNVELVDLSHLVHHLLLATVVRETVMSLGDVDLGEGAVAAFVGQQERGNPGRIGLKREDEHYRTSTGCMLRIREGFRRVYRWLGRGLAEVFGFFDPLLDLANTGEVFVELLLIARGKLASKAAGVVSYEIENRMLARLPFLIADTTLTSGARAKSLSKTNRGFGSGATGLVAVRQARLYW